MTLFLRRLLLCLPLLMLSGCFTWRLSEETTSEETELSVDTAYISPHGDLILQGRLPEREDQKRFMVVPENVMATAIARRKARNKEDLPKVTLPFETEHRYVTVNANDKTFAEFDPHVLDGASPPISLYKKGERLELIPYDWQSTHAELETKALLQGPLHYGRTGGQKAAFAAGLLPAVALDVITSPVQLIGGVAVLIYYETQYGDTF